MGTIPYEIGACSELKVVNLSKGLLSGSIPPSSGNLLKLWELQLCVNKLSSYTPSEITNCTALDHCEVDNTLILRELPSLRVLFKLRPTVVNCSSLRHLSVNYEEADRFKNNYTFYGKQINKKELPTTKGLLESSEAIK